MKFIDFDREYSSIVHKVETGKITLGEYSDLGEALLNKVKAEAYQEGFKAGVEEFAMKYEHAELIGCEDCKHLEDDVNCWRCMAEQLKEKKNEL